MDIKRKRAMEILDDNISDNIDEQLSKIPQSKEWLVDAMIEFNDKEIEKVKNYYLRSIFFLIGLNLGYFVVVPLIKYFLR